MMNVVINITSKLTWRETIASLKISYGKEFTILDPLIMKRAFIRVIALAITK